MNSMRSIKILLSLQSLKSDYVGSAYQQHISANTKKSLALNFSYSPVTFTYTYKSVLTLTNISHCTEYDFVKLNVKKSIKTSFDFIDWNALKMNINTNKNTN